MRKLFVALAVTLLLSVGVAGGAGAAGNDNANCIGRSRSTYNGRVLGEGLSGAAKANQGVGNFVAGGAQTNCGQGHGRP